MAPVTPTLVAFAVVAATTAYALPGQPRSTPENTVRRVGDVTIPYRQRQVIAEDGFDVLHHLSANSPYFNSPGVGLTSDLPRGCSVTDATYLIRHADIYGNDYEYENIISPFLYKLGNFTDKQSFGGDPAVTFLTNWTSPIDDPESEIEKVTDTGKTDAAALGALIAQRYPDILTVNGTDAFRVWTGAATRDEDTAKAFVQGFNGSFSSIELVSVEEGEEQSANTLTPHESCESYSSTTGSDEQQEFINVYAPGVAKRLNGLAGGSAFNWTAMDVYAAQSLCGYDTVIRNMTISGFCNLFSENEWLDYEYANDLNYHRSLGYGNEYTATLGMPWVSASARLLTGEADTTATNSSAGKQHVFISFTHREEPPYIVTALGLYNESNATMPATAINYERAWKTSQILPFLANIALERLSCNATETGNGTQDYVRALVNSAPIPIPGCIDGPDGSCALSNFTKFIADREKQYGNFVEKCGVNVTNATSTLGIYEGQLPAHGAAIEVTTITLNGSLSVDKKKGGSSGGNKGNNTNAATTLSSDRMYWLSGVAAFAAGALVL